MTELLAVTAIAGVLAQVLQLAVSIRQGQRAQEPRAPKAGGPR